MGNRFGASMADPGRPFDGIETLRHRISRFEKEIRNVTKHGAIGHFDASEPDFRR